VERRRADLREVRGFVERHAARGLGQRLRQRLHVVVEACDRDPATIVVQPGDEPGQRMERVGEPAAVAPGVEVLRGALDAHLEPHQAPG
jgi:hypothetical protein